MTDDDRALVDKFMREKGVRVIPCGMTSDAMRDEIIEKRRGGMSGHWMHDKRIRNEIRRRIETIKRVKPLDESPGVEANVNRTHDGEST